MKKILPSLRERKRYMVFEIIGRKRIEPEAAMKEIYGCIVSFIGELELSKAALWMLRDKWAGNKGVIRLNRQSVAKVKAALCLVDKIGKANVMIRTLGVSGMLNRAERKYMV